MFSPLEVRRKLTVEIRVLFICAAPTSAASPAPLAGPTPTCSLPPLLLHHSPCALWLPTIALLPEVIGVEKSFSSSGISSFLLLEDQSSVDSIIFNIRISRNQYLHNKDIFSICRH